MVPSTPHMMGQLIPRLNAQEAKARWPPSLLPSECSLCPWHFIFTPKLPGRTDHQGLEIRDLLFPPVQGKGCNRREAAEENQGIVLMTSKCAVYMHSIYVYARSTVLVTAFATPHRPRRELLPHVPDENIEAQSQASPDTPPWPTEQPRPRVPHGPCPSSPRHVSAACTRGKLPPPHLQAPPTCQVGHCNRHRKHLDFPTWETFLTHSPHLFL